MRAKGQCFICKQPTHLAKDCPTHSTVRLDNAPRASLSSKSININYSVLDKLTNTLEDDNYLDLDLIADNTIDPSSSSTCIHSMAIQLLHSDDSYASSTLQNENYNSLTGYQAILQVFSIERLDLRLQLFSKTAEPKIPFVNTVFRKEQQKEQTSIFSRGRFYGKYNDTVCFGVQECLIEGILYSYNWKCNRRL